MAGYLLALVAGIFAAWGGHQVLFRHDITPVIPPSASWTRRAATRPALGPLVPLLGGEGRYDPLAAAGLVLLHDDPTGIAPPAGAKMTLAFAAPDEGGRLVQAEYAWEGTFQAAVDYYRRQLSASRWELLSALGAADDHRLLAARGRTRAIVSLRNDARDAKIVDIQVVLMTPSDETE